MARVGVDIDGVLYPFEDELRKALVRGRWRTEDECPPSTHWHFYEDWKMDGHMFVAYCDMLTDKGELFRHGDPYPGAVDQMHRLKGAGHTIVLITNRNFGNPENMRWATSHWLEDQGIPYDELHFVKDKREIDVDYHVDDHTPNYIDMRGKGVNSWLLNQPWNENDLATFRVESLADYVDYVLGCEGEKRDYPLICVECGNDDAREGYDECGDCQEAPPANFWADERQDVLDRFLEELTKATGDGSKKRQAGEKPPWYEDKGHEGAIFSHLMKWKRGEQVDPDSGAHPLVHAAWRCLAIACSESGNHP